MKAPRLIFLGLLALSLPALADVHADSAKLVDLTLSTGALAAGKAVAAPILTRLREQGVPEEGIKEVSDASDAYMKSTFSDPELRQEMAQVMEDAYTPEELAAVLAFYQTPAGKKNLALSSVLAQKGEAIGQKYAAKHQPEFEAQVAEIAKRYPRPPTAIPVPAPAPDPAPAPAPAPKKTKKKSS